MNWLYLKGYRRHKRHRFDPWVRKIPWRRTQQPTPVFLPAKARQEPGRLQSVGLQRPTVHSHMTKATEREGLHLWLYSVWLYGFFQFSLVQFSHSVVSDSFRPMNCSMPGLPVHHQLLEFTQTHVHRVSDAIQPSHPLSSPSPPAPNPSQHHGLFQ